MAILTAPQLDTPLREFPQRTTKTHVMMRSGDALTAARKGCAELAALLAEAGTAGFLGVSGRQAFTIEGLHLSPALVERALVAAKMFDPARMHQKVKTSGALAAAIKGGA